jgi:hypothetical protein
MSTTREQGSIKLLPVVVGVFALLITTASFTYAMSVSGVRRDLDQVKVDVQRDNVAINVIVTKLDNINTTMADVKSLLQSHIVSGKGVDK